MFDVDFPIDDVAALQELEAGWRERASCAEWKGQVGAIDGVHFPTMAPRSSDVKDPMRYYVARKAEYALLCIAICNAKRQIIWYDISQSPQTHDSINAIDHPINGPAEECTLEAQQRVIDAISEAEKQALYTRQHVNPRHFPSRTRKT